jgi:hypothetical protein
VLLRPLQDCVQKLDEERAYFRNIIRLELERATTLPPSEAVKILDSLDRAFRILAVGDRKDTD